MRKMRVALFVILFLPVIFCYAKDSSEVSRLVEKNAPGYVLASSSDLSDDAKEYYREMFPDSNPMFVVGDFNGDEKDDYAVIADQCETRVKYFLIFTGDEDGLLRISYELSLENYDDVFLSKIPLGKSLQLSESIQSDKGARNRLEVEHTSVLLTFFEKASLAFYWDMDHSEIVSIQISD